MDPVGTLIVLTYAALCISIGVKLAYVFVARYDNNMSHILLAAAVAQAVIIGIASLRLNIMIVMVTLNLIGFIGGLAYNRLKPKKVAPGGKK